MSLLIAGLTGSGKTSAARLAAQTLGYQWISGSELRRIRPDTTRPDYLGRGESEDDNRQSRPRLIGPRFLAPTSFDVATERDFDIALSKMATLTPRAIFDVWFIPWIMPSGGPQAVFLEAQFETRLTRIWNQMERPDKEYVAQLLKAKDEQARSVARQCYHIDIYTDRTPFGEIIATDDLSINEVARRICILAEDGRCHRTEA
jgi:cytidylate kinase